MLDEEDARLFLFLIVDGIVTVCGSSPEGVVDSSVEVDDCWADSVEVG